MKRAMVAVIAVLASSFAVNVTTVQAQTYGGAPACAKDYKNFWASLERSKFAKMSANQIADLSRTALRGYDSCAAGDERFPRLQILELPNRRGTGIQLRRSAPADPMAALRCQRPGQYLT